MSTLIVGTSTTLIWACKTYASLALRLSLTKSRAYSGIQRIQTTLSFYNFGPVHHNLIRYLSVLTWDSKSVLLYLLLRMGQYTLDILHTASRNRFDDVGDLRSRHSRFGRQEEQSSQVGKKINAFWFHDIRMLGADITIWNSCGFYIFCQG